MCYPCRMKSTTRFPKPDHSPDLRARLRRGRVGPWILLLPVLCLASACEPETPAPTAELDAATAVGGSTVVTATSASGAPDPVEAAGPTRGGLIFPRVDRGAAPGELLAPGGAGGSGDPGPAPAVPDNLDIPLPTVGPPPAAAVGGPCAGIAVRQDGALAIDGQPFTFFGVNAPYLIDPEFPEDQVEPLLAALSARGVNTLRVWYFRSHDPERFARLLDLGARHGLRFVVTLEDNVFRGVDWFFGKEDEEKYRPHLERTVTRFRDRPEILLWEPINEPNCGEGRHDDACLKTIRDWLKMSAGMIKAIDACRVVSSGMIGDGNFEEEERSYRLIHRADDLEMLSVHKRSTDERESELELAEDEERPIFYGEIYDQAYDEGCEPLSGDRSPEARAERIKEDLRRSVEEGVDGYLLWEFAAGIVRPPSGGTRDYCSSFGYSLDDPLWAKLGGSEGLPPPVPWR